MLTADYQAELHAILGSVSPVMVSSVQDAKRHVRNLKGTRSRVNALQKVLRQEIQLAHAPGVILKKRAGAAANLARDIGWRRGPRVLRVVGYLAAFLAPLPFGSWQLERVAIDIDNSLRRLSSEVSDWTRWIEEREPKKPRGLAAL